MVTTAPPDHTTSAEFHNTKLSLSPTDLIRALTATFSSARNSLFDIALPVPALFTAPLSFLENLARNVGSVETFEGMDAEEGTDEVERMVRVVRWWLESLQVWDGEQKKPFAPIIGEQFCCSFAKDGPDGPVEAVRYWAEQVSTSPPQTAMYVENPSGRVKVHGIVDLDGMFAGTGMFVRGLLPLFMTMI